MVTCTRGDLLPADAAGCGALAAPLALLAWVVAQDGASAAGVLLAVLSGAVTSGLGYALWYSVLPHLAASAASVAQLTVPVIAAAAGAVLLGESLTVRLLVAAALVLGGVAFSLGLGRGAAWQRPAGGTARSGRG